jgi:hypothetical protein
MQVTISLENLDLVLLRRQKTALVGMNPRNKAMADAVEGMINLLDHIQDYIVDTGQATKVEVFGPRDEDGCLDEEAEATIQAANQGERVECIDPFDEENYVGHIRARELGAPCICKNGERHIMCPHHGR